MLAEEVVALVKVEDEVGGRVVGETMLVEVVGIKVEEEVLASVVDDLLVVLVVTREVRDVVATQVEVCVVVAKAEVADVVPGRDEVERVEEEVESTEEEVEREVLEIEVVGATEGLVLAG